MCDVLLTRRQLLRYSALVAATFPAGGVLLSQRAYAAGPAVPMNLELVTVTDTTAVITWFTGDVTTLDEFQRPTPVAAPGRVLIGTDPNPLTWVEVGAHEPTAYHYVEVTGLVPGTTYYWRAESGGVPAVQTSLQNPSVTMSGPPLAAPAAFTTMVPPPGQEIGRVAWLNDLHYGESVAGLAVSNDALPRGGVPPGFPVDPDDPYWRFMGAAAVTEARARGCRLLLANGDISSEAQPRDVGEARAMLDSFGALGGSRELRPGDPAAYFVTRGNHDRLHTGAAYGSCSSTDDELADCFGDAFAAGFEPGTTHFSATIGTEAARYRFVGLDSNDGATTGVLRDSELAYLEAELAKGDATIPMFHHPASDLGGLNALGGPGAYGLATADAAKFRAVVAAHSNVAGVYAGHTHRNNRAVSSDTGTVPFFEGGAVKEYPGGYTVVRLYETGYLVNFYKSASPEARAWSERSRGEYLGNAPYYQLGQLSDRNWSYDVDARVRAAAAPVGAAPSMDGVGATTGPAATPASGGTATPSGAGLAATGGSLVGVGLGAAAVGAALAVRHGPRQPPA